MSPRVSRPCTARTGGGPGSIETVGRVDREMRREQQTRCFKVGSDEALVIREGELHVLADNTALARRRMAERGKSPNRVICRLREIAVAFVRRVSTKRRDPVLSVGGEVTVVSERWWNSLASPARRSSGRRPDEGTELDDGGDTRVSKRYVGVGTGTTSRYPGSNGHPVRAYK